MNRNKRSRILIFTLLAMLCHSAAIIAAENNQEESIDKVRKELVEAANSQWNDEYAVLLKKLKEAEKRGEFSSISPPTSLKPFKDWDYYYLEGDGIKWFPNAGQEFKKVFVPNGFVTDLASIPQILWSFGIRPEGSYAYAAIIHDYLYWTQERTKNESDLIFLYAMEDSKVEEGLRNKIYKAVSIAGGPAWENNKKLKEQGEKRILKKFPPDFTTTWSEWKSTPGVFW